MRIAEVIEILSAWAPEENAESWDNVGLQIGSAHSELRKILVALDATERVVDEAVESDANLIITHHPIIFEPLKSITSERHPGSVIFKLIKSDISLYSMHTNLDSAAGGVNAVLSEALGLKDVEPFDDNGIGCYALHGRLDEPLTLNDFLSLLQKRLKVEAMTYRGEKETDIDRVAVCAGAGGSFIEGAIERNADVLVTADLKHSHWLQASGRIAVVDAGHYETESLVLDTLVERLRSVPDLDESMVFRSESEVNPVTLFKNDGYQG